MTPEPQSPSGQRFLTGLIGAPIVRSNAQELFARGGALKYSYTRSTPASRNTSMTILLPPAADAARLTYVLRASGLPDGARVSHVSAMAPPFGKLRSQTFRLSLGYEGQPARAPDSIILKMGHLDDAGRPAYRNANEIAFYRDIASALPEGLVPRCFEAVEATDERTWHLVLEDLTDSHLVATEWPLPPTMAHCEQMVWTLARIHAACWDDPRLGLTLGRWTDDAFWLGEFAATLKRFTERYPEILPPEQLKLYARLLERAPQLLARYGSRRNLTIIHGDAHAWNFFLPRPGRTETARLLDWEGWSISTATDDLAYMMAMLWYPDRRRRLEHPLLDLYHATLVAQGVRDYDRQALAEDYRLSALWLMTRPVWQAMAGIAARVWWNNLERIFLAVDDLGCTELLD
jgi:Ecdysteroid kinase-like family